ncbi:ser thr protein kinase, partial [Chrysochromulina tobinii]
TCGRGRFGRRPGGRECSAPLRTTQNACLPLSSRMPPLPPISSQPCARPLTRGIPETPRMPNAAPHACACGGRPLARGRVWRHRGVRARDACVPPSVGVTEPTPPRGATPMSRSRLMPPGHRTARGGHTPERDADGSTTVADGIVIDKSEVQPSKASLPICVTDAGSVIDASEAQPSKAHAPICVTDLGIVIDASDLQPLKAYPPICVTDSGSVIDASEVQPEKAPLSNLRHRLGDRDRRERGAEGKGAPTNLRHRRGDRDRRKRGAVAKGLITNLRHRRGERDRRERGAVAKGLITNLRH